jgi:hypothetical protein
VVRFTTQPLHPRERTPDTHWIGGWVGLRAGLDAVVKKKILSPCRESNPDCPTRARVQKTSHSYNEHGNQIKHRNLVGGGGQKSRSLLGCYCVPFPVCRLTILTGIPGGIILGEYLNVSQYRFLLNPSQFIIHGHLPSLRNNNNIFQALGLLACSDSEFVF